MIHLNISYKVYPLPECNSRSTPGSPGMFLEQTQVFPVNLVDIGEVEGNVGRTGSLEESHDVLRLLYARLNRAQKP